MYLLVVDVDAIRAPTLKLKDVNSFGEITSPCHTPRCSWIGGITTSIFGCTDRRFGITATTYDLNMTHISTKSKAFVQSTDEIILKSLFSFIFGNIILYFNIILYELNTLR